MDKNVATKVTKKRVKKNVERGQAHINSSFNNTIVTITDSEGNAVSDVTEKTLTYDNIKEHNGLAVRIEASK